MIHTYIHTANDLHRNKGNFCVNSFIMDSPVHLNESKFHLQLFALGNDTVELERPIPMGSRASPRLVKFVQALNFYYVPTIIVIGIIGNILIYKVVKKTPLRNISVVYYLLGLAVTDSMFLTSLFVFWLKSIGIDMVAVSGICQVVLYGTYITSFLTSWYVVAFVIERYIVLWHPLKRSRLCSAKRSKTVTTGLGLIGVLFYSFSVWTSGVSDHGTVKTCSPLPKYWYIITVFSDIDTVFVAAFPPLIILVIAALLSFKLVRLRHCIRERDENELSQYGTCKELKEQLQLTKMLLATALMCMLFGMPIHVMRMRFLFMKHLGGLMVTHSERLVQQVCQMLNNVCYACKVFVFIGTHADFRTSLLAYLKNNCEKGMAGNDYGITDEEENREEEIWEMCLKLFL